MDESKTVTNIEQDQAAGEIPEDEILRINETLFFKSIMNNELLP